MNYCNTILAGTPKSTTDRLKRVLNAAARVVSKTCKFDHGLLQLLHDQLHWLDVPQRIHFKLCTTVRRCLQHKAPSYLVDLYKPLSDIASRQQTAATRRYDLPTVTNFTYSIIIARCPAVQPSLLLAQQPGTHCQTTVEIQHCHQYHILLESDCKLCCSHLTSISVH